MLQTLIIDIDTDYFTNSHSPIVLPQGIVEELNTHHITCITTPNLQAPSVDEFSPQHTLYISNSPERLLNWKQLGYFCIGYNTNDIFLPVSYCFEDLKDLTYSYLSHIMHRYLKLPITITITKHLIIRELAPSDLVKLHEIYQEPHILDYMDEAPEDFTSFYEKRSAYIEKIYGFYDFGIWGVFLKKDNTLIGECGFHPNEINNANEIELGYLLSKKYQKQGYGKEMVRAVLRYAKREFDFDRIIAQISPDNQSSLNLAKKCGLSYEINALKNGKEYYIFSTQKDSNTKTRSSKPDKAAISQKIFSSYSKKNASFVYEKKYKH